MSALNGMTHPVVWNLSTEMPIIKTHLRMSYPGILMLKSKHQTLLFHLYAPLGAGTLLHYFKSRFVV